MCRQGAGKNTVPDDPRKGGQDCALPFTWPAPAACRGAKPTFQSAVSAATNAMMACTTRLMMEMVFRYTFLSAHPATSRGNHAHESHDMCWVLPAAPYKLHTSTAYGRRQVVTWHGWYLCASSIPSAVPARQQAQLWHPSTVSPPTTQSYGDLHTLNNTVSHTHITHRGR